MRCSNCQKELEPHVQFCTGCGQAVKSSTNNIQTVFNDMQQGNVMTGLPHIQKRNQPYRTTNTCTTCGIQLAPGVRFCTSCGTQVSERISHTFQCGCGALVSADMRFCINCGMQVGGSSAYILRCKMNTLVSVNCLEFVIGKKQGMVNYCIADNRAISRIHAKIINKSGQFMIIDLGSTNHTYVNGRSIAVNEQVPLMNGTRFWLADEEFEFKIF